MQNDTIMALRSHVTSTGDVLQSMWTTERLKEFLRKKNLPVSGLKHELIRKVSDFIETEALENELEVKAFKELQVEPPIRFEELPRVGWCKEGLPNISEELT